MRLAREEWKNVAPDANPTIPVVTPRITTRPTKDLP